MPVNINDHLKGEQNKDLIPQKYSLPCQTNSSTGTITTEMGNAQCATSNTDEGSVDSNSTKESDVTLQKTQELQDNAGGCVEPFLDLTSEVSDPKQTNNDHSLSTKPSNISNQTDKLPFGANIKQQVRYITIPVKKRFVGIQNQPEMSRTVRLSKPIVNLLNQNNPVTIYLPETANGVSSSRPLRVVLQKNIENFAQRHKRNALLTSSNVNTIPNKKYNLPRKIVVGNKVINVRDIVQSKDELKEKNKEFIINDDLAPIIKFANYPAPTNVSSKSSLKDSGKLSTVDQQTQTDVYCWLYKNNKLYTVDEDYHISPVPVEKTYAKSPTANTMLPSPVSSIDDDTEYNIFSDQTQVTTNQTIDDCAVYGSSPNKTEVAIPQTMKYNTTNQSIDSGTVCASLLKQTEVGLTTNQSIDSGTVYKRPPNQTVGLKINQSIDNAAVYTHPPNQTLVFPTINQSIDNAAVYTHPPNQTLVFPTINQSIDNAAVYTHPPNQTGVGVTITQSIDNGTVHAGPLEQAKATINQHPLDQNEAAVNDQASDSAACSSEKSKSAFEPKGVYEEQLYTTLGLYNPAPPPVDYPTTISQRVEQQVTNPSPPMDFYPNEVCSDQVSVASNVQDTHENMSTNAGLSKPPLPSNVARLFAKITEDIRSCLVQDECGNIPLHKAVINNNITKLKSQSIVLKAIKSHLDHVNFAKETALMVAVKLARHNEAGYLEAVRVLVIEGADQTISDNEGYAPLHYAVKYGCTEIVEVLLSTPDAQKVVGEFCSEGLSPLHLAAIGDHHQIISLLVNKEADINVKDRISGRTPYCHAVKMGNANAANMLLTLNANSSEPNFSSQLPSASEFNQDMPQFLHELGLDQVQNTPSNRRIINRASDFDNGSSSFKPKRLKTQNMITDHSEYIGLERSVDELCNRSNPNQTGIEMATVNGEINRLSQNIVKTTLLKPYSSCMNIGSLHNNFTECPSNPFIDTTDVQTLQINIPNQDPLLVPDFNSLSSHSLNLIPGKLSTSFCDSQNNLNSCASIENTSTELFSIQLLNQQIPNSINSAYIANVESSESVEKPSNNVDWPCVNPIVVDAETLDGLPNPLESNQDNMKKETSCTEASSSVGSIKVKADLFINQNHDNSLISPQILNEKSYSLGKDKTIGPSVSDAQHSARKTKPQNHLKTFKSFKRLKNTSFDHRSKFKTSKNKKQSLRTTKHPKHIVRNVTNQPTTQTLESCVNDLGLSKNKKQSLRTNKILPSKHPKQIRNFTNQPTTQTLESCVNDLGLSKNKKQSLKTNKILPSKHPEQIVRNVTNQPTIQTLESCVKDLGLSDEDSELDDEESVKLNQTNVQTHSVIFGDLIHSSKTKSFPKTKTKISDDKILHNKSKCSSLNHGTSSDIHESISRYQLTFNTYYENIVQKCMSFNNDAQSSPSTTISEEESGETSRRVVDNSHVKTENVIDEYPIVVIKRLENNCPQTSQTLTNIKGSSKIAEEHNKNEIGNHNSTSLPIINRKRRCSPNKSKPISEEQCEVKKVAIDNNLLSNEHPDLGKCKMEDQILCINRVARKSVRPRKP